MDPAVAAVTGRAVRHPDADPLLRPFLDAENEETASRLLGDLLVRHAGPVVRAVVARQVRAGGLIAGLGRAPAP